MSFSEGITINNKHSYEDFGLVINAREIGIPEKRSVRKSVPFFNGFYDFSALNGSPSWGERTIKYTFDIIGATVAEMDEERTAVLAWLCNVHDADIFDDTIPEYHFHGSYDSYSMTEDGEHVQLTVVFVCQPFMRGNPIVQPFGTAGTATATFTNTGMPTKIVAETTGYAVLTSGNVQQTIPEGVKDYKTAFTVDQSANIAIQMTNELDLPYTTASPNTSAGVTFTNNYDGTVTASGTATGQSVFYFRGQRAAFQPYPGRHFFRCCEGGSSSTFNAVVYVVSADGTTKGYTDYGAGVWVTIPENLNYVSVYARIVSGYTADNVVFTPEMYGELKLSITKEVI